MLAVWLDQLTQNFLNWVDFSKANFLIQFVFSIIPVCSASVGSDLNRVTALFVGSGWDLFFFQFMKEWNYVIDLRFFFCFYVEKQLCNALLDDTDV